MAFAKGKHATQPRESTQERDQQNSWLSVLVMSLNGILLAVAVYSVLRSVRAMGENVPADPHGLGAVWFVAGFSSIYVAFRWKALPWLLMTHVEKEREVTPTSELTCSSLEQVVEVWKQVIVVQMHFNDMVMKVRNFALTLVTAIVAGALLAYKENLSVTVGLHESKMSSIVIMAGLAGWLAFYFLDRFYYHALLVGAVAQGKIIEDLVRDRMPYMQLSKTITAFSHVKLSGGRPGSIRARDKLDLFYLFVAALLGFGLLFVTYAGRPT